MGVAESDKWGRGRAEKINAWVFHPGTKQKNTEDYTNLYTYIGFLELFCTLLLLAETWLGKFIIESAKSPSTTHRFQVTIEARSASSWLRELILKNLNGLSW